MPRLDFVDMDGVAIGFDAMEVLRKNPDNHFLFTKDLGGETLYVWTRYAGTGGDPFECTVDSTNKDLASHKDYYGFKEKIRTRALAIKEHARIVAAVDALLSDDLEKIPLGDKTDAEVQRKAVNKRP